MFTVSIELPESVKVALGDTGRETVVDVKAISANPDVLRFAVINGFMGALNNISRGKDDESGAANSDAVWESMRAKRAAVWLTGEWASRGGGGGQSNGLKEAFVSERLAAGATLAQIESHIKQSVKVAFGEKEPASFARFLDSLAISLATRDNAGKKPTAEAVSGVRDKLEMRYKKLADEARAARDTVKGGMDLSDITFD